MDKHDCSEVHCRMIVGCARIAEWLLLLHIYPTIWCQHASFGDAVELATIEGGGVRLFCQLIYLSIGPSRSISQRAM